MKFVPSAALTIVVPHLLLLYLLDPGKIQVSKPYMWLDHLAGRAEVEELSNHVACCQKGLGNLVHQDTQAMEVGAWAAISTLLLY